ncbi:hypothetical protein [Altericista sp. CCNU0014]|uniref:hypothetical protein n=1 Tax=Altericista sp. CCNU0014 TaxID=3082949 RepID=UPI00384EB608
MVKQFSQRLDRAATSIILLLGIPLALLLYAGDATYPKVRAFSWQDRSVGAEDIAFILTFNRPMNWDSVAANLSIVPPLPGKFSASGRRFAYTLHQPIPYGQTFRLAVRGATDGAVGQKTSQRAMQPFASQFRSRDRAFVYLGVGGAEDGRLVLRNLTQQQTTVLTPKNWVVTTFKPYPEGDRILVGAVERGAAPAGAFEQKLYAVSTGLGAETAGQTKLLLDNADAQILKFDLSANGSAIVLQRYGRSKREPVSLWTLAPNGTLRSLETAAAGEFLVVPDGSAVAIAQNKGIAIVPIAPEADLNRIEYLPQLGTTIGFSRDASSAAMMKFNPNGTRSLFLVTDRGVQKELLQTNGYILKAQFDPTHQKVFCLYTQLARGRDLRPTLHLSAIELNTRAREDLVRLPGQASGHMSLAPDGSQLLFDAVEVSEQPTTSLLKDATGQAIAKSTLWILPLDSRSRPKASQAIAQPSALSLSGTQPYWLP